MNGDHPLRSSTEDESPECLLTGSGVVARGAGEPDLFDFVAQILGRPADGPDGDCVHIVGVRSDRGQCGDVFARQ